MSPTLKTYLPNSNSDMALVSLRDERPFRAYWPIRLTQIFGGKRWSLSLVRHTTRTPLLTPSEAKDEQ